MLYSSVKVLVALYPLAVVWFFRMEIIGAYKARLTKTIIVFGYCVCFGCDSECIKVMQLDLMNFLVIKYIFIVNI